MKEFERVQIESRAALRAWLEANHTRTESIWLVTFKGPTIPKRGRLTTNGGTADR